MKIPKNKGESESRKAFVNLSFYPTIGNLYEINGNGQGEAPVYKVHFPKLLVRDTDVFQISTTHMYWTNF